MKVLLINGSPHQNGNTFLALKEVATALETEGIETEIFWLGNKPIRGCIACGACKTKQLGKCVFDDDVCNRLVERFAEADAFVVGSPTYYGQPAGALLAVLQRALVSGGAHVAGKPVACVAVCRRGGSTATFQCLNMPFAMINCLIVGSQYWNIAFGNIAFGNIAFGNIAFGREAGQAAQDTEGMQTMRTLGRNMSWVLKNIRREGAAPRPPQEDWQPMNFIR